MESEFYEFDGLKLFKGPSPLEYFEWLEDRPKPDYVNIDGVLIERKERCCKECGIYLEPNEFNLEKLCSVCINKTLSKPEVKV